MYKYTYDITRDGDVTTTIETDHPLTTGQQIMTFYDRGISSEDRNKIISAYNGEGFLDFYDYIKNSLIGHSTCIYRDLMGDCLSYGGLRKVGENHYEVILDY